MAACVSVCVCESCGFLCPRVSVSTCQYIDGWVCLCVTPCGVSPCLPAFLMGTNAMGLTISPLGGFAFFLCSLGFIGVIGAGRKSRNVSCCVVSFFYAAIPTVAGFIVIFFRLLLTTNDYLEVWRSDSGCGDAVAVAVVSAAVFLLLFGVRGRAQHLRCARDPHAEHYHRRLGLLCERLPRAVQRNAGGAGPSQRGHFNSSPARQRRSVRTRAALGAVTHRTFAGV